MIEVIEIVDIELCYKNDDNWQLENTRVIWSKK